MIGAPPVLRVTMVEFFGGPWDGERRHVPERAWGFRVALMLGPPARWVADVDSLGPKPFAAALYRRDGARRDRMVYVGQEPVGVAQDVAAPA